MGHIMTLVSTDWLSEQLGNPDLRVFDTTVHFRPTKEDPYNIESGLAEFDGAHIPGAAFLDLMDGFSVAGARLRFTKPTHSELVSAFGQAGVGTDSQVVFYSTTSPMWATRAWWMLRAAGFGNVSVLDGGFGKWRAENRETESGAHQYAPATLSLSENASCWADKEEVRAAMTATDVCTINALTPDIYAGTSSIHYGRKGHIPGSVNVSFSDLLQEDGTYKPTSALKPLFEASGALSKPRAICYCGGGIAATMDALALTELGHPSVAVYDGSMSEWGMDENLPVETGAG